ncbi:WXG100 family type VII secretion target [Aquihabitans sp. G128]|uniref:WXG100 family type VII secretion target n=1 Tax=Aquihabitans sp. G128 TaxID=2849779 RepID=UPI001C244755|nr:WXG100 family type VII secretion target [Aquihabitans sp. G128]QXC61372.1 WXG100 family type VII secretion target [Aquihabitans sp. G128]
MSVIGGQIDQLDQLGVSFTRRSGEVEDLLSALRGELSSAYWKGGAADRFRSAWDSEYEPALRSLSSALIDASDEIKGRARALEQAGG